MAAAVSLLFIFLWGGVQSFAALALLPILLYNGGSAAGRSNTFLYILSGASGHFMAAETDPGADVRISGVTYETNRTF